MTEQRDLEDWNELFASEADDAEWTYKYDPRDIIRVSDCEFDGCLTATVSDYPDNMNTEIDVKTALEAVKRIISDKELSLAYYKALELRLMRRSMGVAEEQSFD